jgi:hypothetical protein
MSETKVYTVFNGSYQSVDIDIDFESKEMKEFIAEAINAQEEILERKNIDIDSLNKVFTV